MGVYEGVGEAVGSWNEAVTWEDGCNFCVGGCEGLGAGGIGGGCSGVGG